VGDEARVLASEDGNTRFEIERVKDGDKIHLVIGGSDRLFQEDGQPYFTVRPEINIDEIKKQLVPTQVQAGVFFGYSLPIYAADNEELYFRTDVPGRWTEEDDIIFHVKCCLDQAEDVGDEFRLQFSWEHAPYPGILPATSNDVEVETTLVAGRVAPYDQYEVTFTIDYDIDGAGSEIKFHELLGGRLRRVAAAGDEIDGEIIILDWHLHYPVNKFYNIE